MSLDALDGSAVSEHGPTCACLEKTTEWFRYAVAKWPYASYYGKTEDDTYIHIDALIFELTCLSRHGNGGGFAEALKEVRSGVFHGECFSP